MSLIFKKEHGYPVDLEIKAESEADSKWYYVSIIINDKEQLQLAFDTKYPIETRKAWANGFFAGYTFSEKKRG
jgi:hypothetical protein